jgi:hypothetical protein
METIIAAIISGLVASLGVFVSLLSTRWTLNFKTKELDLKNNEFGVAMQKIKTDLEAIRQSQFSEIVSKRAEIYPLLWSTIREYTTNWDDEKKAKDLLWIKEFLASLNQIDSKGGVFFSQAVYERFHELQQFLFKLKEQFIITENKTVTIEDLDQIDTIFRGKPGGSLGLAAYLKDDLGSYRDISIQARPISTEVKPDRISKSGEETNSKNLTSTNIFYKSYPCPGISGIFTISHEDIKRCAKLRKEYLKISESVLLTPTTGILAVESILKSQPDFINILDCLREYIFEEYLEDNDRRFIETTESLFLSGLIDGFCSISIKRFIETHYKIQFSDHEWNFDTLLELAALVYIRILEKRQNQK